MGDQSEDSDRVYLIICNLLLGIIFLTGFIANVLVLFVFYRKSGLRTIANRFVVNLMVINLVSCLSLLPLSLAENSVKQSDEFLCIVTELSSVFCSTVIVYAVLLIALDQYCAVTDPLHYHRIISSSKSILMIIFSWCLSAIFVLMDGLQWGNYEGAFQRCRYARIGATEDAVTERRAKIYRFSFCAVYTASVFVLPFALICFIYYKICVAASGNTKRTRTSCVSIEDSVHSVHSTRERTDADSNASEDLAMVDDAPKRDTDVRENLETSGLLSKYEEIQRGKGSQPSFVLTRASPPRNPTDGVDSDSGDVAKNFLKPTLKNNSSLTRLSSLHIQFSEETGCQQGERRRHSNSADPVLDPEFQAISKSRSPSIQSSPIEVPVHKASSRCSRSPSINSSTTRHPASRASSIRSTSSCIVHNIRHRISNASLFRYREEARAARISALVIVMALACWLPFFTAFYLRSDLVPANGFPYYLHPFSIALLLLSTALSPFLFAFRNRKIKKEIRKLLTLRGNGLGSDCAKSFYRYNFSFDLKSRHLLLGLGRKQANEYKINSITY